MMWKAGIGLQGALDMGKSMWITTCYDEVVLQITTKAQGKRSMIWILMFIQDQSVKNDSTRGCNTLSSAICQ